jgi:hypothetical protein
MNDLSTFIFTLTNAEAVGITPYMGCTVHRKSIFGPPRQKNARV